jgi:signal transduction histidine kinase
VFEPFTRLNPVPEGLGIGLPLVKKIAESHGGKVWIEGNDSSAWNPDGRGISVVFQLPLDES